jgi:adenosylhomocysteine nucleosidase
MREASDSPFSSAFSRLASGFSSPPLTAVIAAMPEEVRPLQARLAGADKRRLQFCTAVVGRLGPNPVAVAVSGNGDRNARAATAELLRRLPVGRVLIVGVAGALSPRLPPCALVVGDEIQHVDGTRLATPPALAAWAAETCGARRARVISARAIIDTAAEKTRLGARFGAGAAAAVVDLESAGCAAIADAAGLPWLVLRAIADTATEAVPALLNRCLDEGGAIGRGRVVGALLRNPGALPGLLELRRRVQICADVLVPAIQRLLDSWPAPGDGNAVPGTRNGEELHDRRR